MFVFVAGVATNIQLGGAAVVAAPPPPVMMNPQLGMPGIVTNPALGPAPQINPIPINPGFGAPPGKK